MDSLMRSSVVEVCHIPIEHALELPLVIDQDMIKAFLSHTPQEAFADRIGSGSVIRGFKNLDGTRLCNPCETQPKLAIIIPDEVLRPRAIAGGFPKLLCRPSIGGRSCDTDMDNFTRVQEGVEEGEQRAEEEIRDRQEVARPDLLSMRM